MGGELGRRARVHAVADVPVAGARARREEEQVAGLRLRHGLLLLATLGLYAPWAQVAARRMRLQALTIVSRVVPDDLAATVRQAGDTRPGGELFGLDLGW